MENLAKIKQRVIFFVESQGIKKEDFYKKISSNGGNFRGKSLQSELSGEKIAEILANYTNLNPEWLILGKGEMLKDANAIPKCSEPPIHYNVEVDYKNKYLEVLEELTSLSRDTSITELLLSNIPTISVQKHARHSSLEMTQIYADHITPKMLEDIKTNTTNLF